MNQADKLYIAGWTDCIAGFKDNRIIEAHYLDGRNDARNALSVLGALQVSMIGPYPRPKFQGVILTADSERYNFVIGVDLITRRLLVDTLRTHKGFNTHRFIPFTRLQVRLHP